MIGPTGVGKTEIARRLATLTGAPFIKVEATKYTEVGYYGRDVESMVRELVENAIGLVREQRAGNASKPEAKRRVDERLLDLLAPPPPHVRRRRRLAATRPSATSAPAKRCGRCCVAGELEDRKVEITIEQKAHADDDPRHGPGSDRWTSTSRACSRRSCPRHVSRREMTVAEARQRAVRAGDARR